MDHLPKVESIEISRTIKGLSRRLRQPSFGGLIAVLLASDLDDLKDFVAIGDLLSRIPLILILPDTKRATTCLGHKLFPRFISYVWSDPSDVSAVLSKMLAIYSPEEAGNPIDGKVNEMDLVEDPVGEKREGTANLFSVEG